MSRRSTTRRNFITSDSVKFMSQFAHDSENTAHVSIFIPSSVNKGSITRYFNLFPQRSLHMLLQFVISMFIRTLEYSPTWSCLLPLRKVDVFKVSVKQTAREEKINKKSFSLCRICSIDLKFRNLDLQRSMQYRAMLGVAARDIISLERF